ncbi:MAG: hypothetical protein LBQ86_06035 [Holophagales bacterium]|jgi:hypothetical protein|nr:hypothetical protein [Holophagales bacterium]
MNIPKSCLISLLSAAVCGFSGSGGGSSSSAGASPVMVRTVETAAAQTGVTETVMPSKNAETAQSRTREQANPTMTITLDIEGEIGFHIAGQLDVTIDWGDGSPVETRELEGAGSGDFNDNQYYRHVYSDASSRTITITGVKISYLDCGLSQKPLKSLDVSKNPELDTLLCYHSDLTSLDVSKNPRLIELHCSNNQLTSLNLSKNPNLARLNVSSNQLTALDLSKNSSLTTLRCDFNQLKSLDVSRSRFLRDLEASNNQLKSLDVSRNEYLEELSVANNQLAKLNVNKIGEIRALYLQNNLLPASALNALFGEMKAKSIAGTDKYIRITGNPGTYDCRISIAQGKGWKVIDFGGNIVPDNGTLTAPPIMTLTLVPEASEEGLRIDLVGSGKVSIDWGDGAPPETRDLSETNPLYDGWSEGHFYRHVYSGLSPRTISITGVVTFMVLSNRGLTALDVSKNLFLENLWCDNNQLKILDVSKNTDLAGLTCGNNQLTSLDVSKNTKLEVLACKDNQLTGLTINKNLESLRYVSLINNRLSAPVLNTIFESLHSEVVYYEYEGERGESEKVIYIEGNPGADDCDLGIARKKGWNVYGGPSGYAGTLEDMIIKTIKAYQNQDEETLNDLLLKDFGIAFLYRPGVFDLMSVSDRISFDKPVPEYLSYGIGLEADYDYKVKFEKLPDFDCGDEGEITWNKPNGIYCDAANTTKILSSRAKRLNELEIDNMTWTEEEIKRFEEIENKSHQVIVMGEGVFNFYVTFIEGKWYLIVIDRFEYCSGS